jgi:hypothetical protein
VQRAQAGVERRLLQEQLEAEREKNAIAHEKLRLKKEYEQAEIEAGHPVTLLKIEREVERLQKELEKRASENRLEELKLQLAMLQEKARHELRKELLPLEQLPAVARALSGIFRGMHLTTVGQEVPMLTSLMPMLDLLTHKLREGMQLPEK